jgi:hypothetical protein
MYGVKLFPIAERQTMMEKVAGRQFADVNE